jgi:predicted enzyme related to lactoylglutathione lyase
MSTSTAQSQITFLYYDKLEPAAQFYEKVLKLELVEDQGFARIYRTAPQAFVGLVAGERGFHQPSPASAVLVTLAVEDVDGWYARVQAHDVKILRELATHDSIQVRCFFIEDPGGYAIEIQKFLKPALQEVFHPPA